MLKYASRFQFAIYLQQGYTIVDWNKTSAGLYLKAKSFRNNFKTKLAASGTREELEAFVKEMLNE